MAVKNPLTGEKVSVCSCVCESGGESGGGVCVRVCISPVRSSLGTHLVRRGIPGFAHWPPPMRNVERSVLDSTSA